MSCDATDLWDGASQVYLYTVFLSFHVITLHIAGTA